MQSAASTSPMEPNDPLEFPSSYLQDLQSRVFVQDWSIPYKEDEALARCMHATIRLVEAGLLKIYFAIIFQIMENSMINDPDHNNLFKRYIKPFITICSYSTLCNNCY